MKKTARILLCAVLAVLLALGGICIYAANYSSADDPLISLSYINEVLLPLVKDMITANNEGRDIGQMEATAPVETTSAPAVTEEPLPEGTVETGARFVAVHLDEGQTLFASVYACEVIVRSGKTSVVSPFTVKWEEQGVSDTTDGVELYNEAAIPQNHTILIPRDDGRGIACGEGGAWILVRGTYIVK